jgi:hypothetical protein
MVELKQSTSEFPVFSRVFPISKILREGLRKSPGLKKPEAALVCPFALLLLFFPKAMFPCPLFPQRYKWRLFQSQRDKVRISALVVETLSNSLTGALEFPYPRMR